MSDTKSYEDQLARIDLFAGLSSRSLRKLAERSREVEYDAGHKVAEEGLGALAFHLVLDGAAEVSVGGQRVRTLHPGDYFGEISVIDGKPRSASVEASGPLRTLVVPYQVFHDLLDNEKSFARPAGSALREAAGGRGTRLRLRALRRARQLGAASAARARCRTAAER